jgi:hypothetical protein
MAQASPKKKRGRPPKSEATKTVGRRKKNDWATLMSQVDEGTVIDYNMQNEYEEMAAINHKNFGLGVITKVLDDNKIQVVFEDYTKVLAQNWE